jgi:thymidylate synthase (FAD)
MNKEPKVKLISWTSEPIKTMFWGFLNMHNKVPDNLSEINLTEEKEQKFLELMIKQPHQTVFEYVKTTWLLENVSRAFQQQLTRTRQASYSIQSLRIVNPGNFADERNYHIPSSIVSKNLQGEFHSSMLTAQEHYSHLVKSGASTEDARGVLPLNIFSPITMSIDLRALAHMLELRMCLNTQEEFRIVAKQMKEEIGNKINRYLADNLFMPNCEKEGICNSPVPCARAKKYKTKVDSTALDLGWLKG